jgi:hypothetical protein
MVKVVDVRYCHSFSHVGHVAHVEVLLHVVHGRNAEDERIVERSG